MYDSIAACSNWACCSSALLSAAACSSWIAGVRHARSAPCQRARVSRLLLRMTAWKALSRSTTWTRRSNDAALIEAARALSSFADFSFVFAAKKRPSVAPIAAAPSAVNAVTRPATLCSNEPFNNGGEILRIERFTDEGVGSCPERGLCIVVALPRGDDDHL